MLAALKPILEIQELDMQMIQLMRLKKERQKELNNINSVKEDLRRQVAIKENVIIDLKKNIRIGEGEVEEVKEKLKKLEAQQSSIKKVEEFNALSQEMSQTERERSAKEQLLSELYDKLAIEEEVLTNLQQSLSSTTESSKVLEAEILESVRRINAEGRDLKERRDHLVQGTDSDIFHIYERLLGNKRDRVLVPIENRCCSGCHIMITAQDENMVRKGERLVFCEHCSRIHYWPESEALEEASVTPSKRRRRRQVKAV